MWHIASRDHDGRQAQGASRLAAQPDLFRRGGLALRESRAVILFLALSGLVITLLVAHWLYRLEVRNAEQAFHAEVAERADSLQRELQAGIEGLYTLREMVRYVDSLPALVFDDVAAAIMARNATILSLEWLPVVGADERLRFEQGMQAYQPDYRILEMTGDGVTGPAGERDLYAPVAFVYPRYTNHRVIGFDMLSLPLRAQAMERARDSGTLAASAPLTLRLRARPGQGIGLVVPVFMGQPGDLASRRQALRGYVMAVFETSALANRILPARAGQRYLSIEDVTDPNQVSVYFRKGELSDLGLYSLQLPEVGGRRLQVTMAPPASYFVSQTSPLPLVTAILGLVMVVLVCGYLYLLQRRGELVTRLVAERTRELQEANDRLAQMSVTDPLTGVANRRAMDEYLEMEWSRGQREQEPLTVVMLDVDHFKRINDEYGHDAGDQCLQRLSAELGQHFRRSVDLVARFGGEEFAVLMPNTPGDVISRVEQFRAKVAAMPVELADGQHLMMTVSAGVASVVPASHLAPRDLLRSADEALYEAKREGRNRVVLASQVLPLEKGAPLR